MKIKALFKAFVKTATKRKKVIKLKETGLSHAEIGRKLGVSRQRVWQIANRKSKGIPGPKVMITTGDVAQLLGLSVNTVRKWTDKGVIKAYRMGPRGDRRYRRKDINDFLKEAAIWIVPE